MAMVGQFFKYTTFVPMTRNRPVEEAAKLFIKHVVKYWRVP